MAALARLLGVLLLAFALARPAAAEPPALAVDLATVATNTGELARVLGSVGNGAKGVPVAGGHDVDGDGALDTGFASMQASPLSRPGAGEVYLVFGNGTLTGTLDTAVVQERILRFAGAGTLETAGSELWMDDVTGDGTGDFLIARQNFTPDPGRPGAGALTIVVGGSELRTHAATGAYFDLAAPPAGTRVTTIVGVGETDRLGMWMRTGDVTGDGIADIVVGSDQADGGGETHRGTVYVIRGGAHLDANQTIDLASFGATALVGHIAQLTPPAGSAEHHLGATVQLGDLDGNGRAEVLAAAALNRSGGSIPADGTTEPAHASGGAPGGTLYIVWDDAFPPGLWTAGFSFDIANPPGTSTTITGGAGNVSLGEEILAGFDFDASGDADLFVGDIAGDPGFAGRAYVIYDAAALKGESFAIDAPPAGVVVTTFQGAAPGHIAGDTALAGDLDGDGRDDLAFSSPHASPLGRPSAGTLHVFFGKNGPWPAAIDLADLPSSSAVRITEVYGANGTNGADSGDTLIYSAAAADLDGDGTVDVIGNEMEGNGTGAGATDVGNLILISGAALAAPTPIPTLGRSSGSLALALAALLLALALRAHRPSGAPSWPARPCADDRPPAPRP